MGPDVTPLTESHLGLLYSRHLPPGDRIFFSRRYIRGNSSPGVLRPGDRLAESDPSSVRFMSSETSRPADRLLSGSFVGLLVTQLLGAINDNMFRWLVIGVGKDHVDPSQHALILSLGLATFVLPYLVLAAPAGYLADRFSKRHVIVGCKIAEIGIMALATVGLWLDNIVVLFIAVMLMGSQSALFSPAKFGSIPEMLRSEKISSANGVLGLTTVVAAVLGAAAGNYLYDFAMRGELHRVDIAGGALLGVAIVGYLASLLIHSLPSANPNLGRERTMLGLLARIPGQTWQELATLGANKALLRVAMGIALFWSLGSLAQLNIDQFGFEGGLDQSEIVPLLLSLVIGVGLGSVLAGIWSSGHVELGMVPLGAAGMTLASLLLYTVSGVLETPADTATPSFIIACVYLFLLGASAGLFDVPLEAFLQHRSPPEKRGSVLAASNFITFAGMLITAGLYYLLRAVGPDGEPWFTAREIFLLAGLFTVPVFVYAVYLLPQATVRFLMWLASHTVYRVRIHGRENLPPRGGALLTPNHVSWVDGVLLLVSSSRLIRMVVWAPYADKWYLSWLARVMNVIPVHPQRPRQVREALERIREALEDGELVCIFPEGGISRTGELQPFKPGLIKAVEGLDVPVVPVYLAGLWESIFSYRGGKVLGKWPSRVPLPVDVHFGPPIRHPENIEEIEQAVHELGQLAEPQPEGNAMMLPPQRFIRTCRRNWRKSQVADSLGMDMDGSSLLTRTLVFRQVLNRLVLDDDERYVGVLLPPSGGAVLANLALTLGGRVAVNLNYTVSSSVLESCIRQAGIRRVITSRKLIEKQNIQLSTPLVYLEELKDQVSLKDKLLGWVQARLPLGMLERQLGLDKLKPDDELTVIFTSGSTGEPKGVLLSYRNVDSNIEGIDMSVRLRPDDVLIGIVPFFHSLGFSVALWGVNSLDIKGIYHTSPLEPRQIGKLAKEHRATILLATPTFLRSYVKRIEPEDFAAVDLVITGAEKLSTDVANAFEAKFGVRPMEGYGTTELSPLVSVNVPTVRVNPGFHRGAREGSVGQPIYNVEVRIVDPDTRRELPTGQEGMLLVRGPNVMLGYLNHPEQTDAVLHDGWYITGDIARLDEEGFIFITGRLSRFSKLAGEMVPHVTIEEALQRLIGDEPGGEVMLAVTAVPDEKKGERLVVLYTHMEKTPQELCRALSEEGFPNLYIPSPENFRQVAEIPLLGSGKLDLKGLNDMAREQFDAPAAS